MLCTLTLSYNTARLLRSSVSVSVSGILTTDNYVKHMVRGRCLNNWGEPEGLMVRVDGIARIS